MWGPVAFVAGYALATVAFVPGSLLTLAAGAIFGLVKGTALVFVAATLGASVAFLVARYRRSRTDRTAPGRATSDSPPIDRAVAAEGRKIVLLLRLSPVFPFNLLNYALGLTRSGSSITSWPRSACCRARCSTCTTARLAGDVARLAGGVTVRRGRRLLACRHGSACLPLSSSPRSSTRAARRALQEATDGQRPPAEPEAAIRTNGRLRVEPFDRYNRELVANVHPSDWVNPEPAPATIWW